MLKTISLALALTALSGAALADDDRKTSRSDWMSIGALSAKLEGQGYVIREIEIDDDAYEVKAVDPDGRRVEADVNPRTGEPLRRWKQDD